MIRQQQQLLEKIFWILFPLQILIPSKFMQIEFQKVEKSSLPCTYELVSSQHKNLSAKGYLLSIKLGYKILYQGMEHLWTTLFKKLGAKFPTQVLNFLLGTKFVSNRPL
jgi:hypothetical protein